MHTHDLSLKKVRTKIRKKFLCTTFLLAAHALLAVAALAQEISVLRLGIAAGYGPVWPVGGHHSGNALLLNLEPSCAVKENLSVGARFELGYGKQTISSVGFFTQYYLTNDQTKSWRPFVGLGLGYYHPSLNNLDTSPYSSSQTESKVGFFPRVGFNYRHLAVTMEYNIVPSSKTTLSYGFPNEASGYLQNSYLGLKVGVIFGRPRVKFSQEYNKTRVGFGFGYTPGSTSSSAAPIIYVEPSYRVKNDISIGARLEYALFGAASYGVNTQYYFSNRYFRPFVGLGMGIYYISFYSDVPNYTFSPQDDDKFGFYPRVGFDVGHFTVTLDYNIVPPSRVRVTTSQPSQPVTITNNDYQNSYLGLKVGFFLGGGRKKEKD